MSEEFVNYYLHTKPNKYPSSEVGSYLLNKGLILKAGVSYEPNLVNSAIDYDKHVAKLLTEQLVSTMVENKKAIVQTYDHPLYPNRRMTVEAIVMTKSDILDMLGYFGVNIYENPKK